MKLISLEPQALRVKAKHLTGKGPLSDVGAGQLPVKKEAVTGQQSQGQKGSLSCHAVHTKTTDPNLSAQRKLKFISFSKF